MVRRTENGTKVITPILPSSYFILRRVERHGPPGALVTSDAQKAREVIQDADVVDALNRIIIDQLQEPSEHIVPGVHCFSASGSIERVADLATSLAEDTIYLIEGELVRHKHGESTRQ